MTTPPTSTANKHDISYILERFWPKVSNKLEKSYLFGGNPLKGRNKCEKSCLAIKQPPPAPTIPIHRLSPAFSINKSLQQTTATQPLPSLPHQQKTAPHRQSSFKFKFKFPIPLTITKTAASHACHCTAATTTIVPLMPPVNWRSRPLRTKIQLVRWNLEGSRMMWWI